MLREASGLKKGVFNLFNLFLFSFLEGGCVISHMQPQRCHVTPFFRAGFIPLRQTPSVQGFPGAGWLLFPQELFWQGEGLAFLGTTTFSCFEMKG